MDRKTQYSEAPSVVCLLVLVSWKRTKMTQQHMDRGDCVAAESAPLSASSFPPSQNEVSPLAMGFETKQS